MGTIKHTPGDAAAPDLLEALKVMVDLANSWGKEWFNREELAKIELAKTVLNKATLQTQPVPDPLDQLDAE